MIGQSPNWPNSPLGFSITIKHGSNSVHKMSAHFSQQVNEIFSQSCKFHQFRGCMAAWLGACSGDSAWAGVVGAAHGLGLVPLVGGLYVSSCAG